LQFATDIFYEKWGLNFHTEKIIYISENITIFAM